MSEIIAASAISYEHIAAVLREGRVIVYPTDTAYALGCDPTNQEAVDRIFEIKQRLGSKTLSLIAASSQMAHEWAEFGPQAHELARAHWPGPLTLVLPAKKNLAESVIAKGCIALRVPDSSIAQKISASLGKLVVATSANTSGQGVCYTIEAVQKSLGARAQDVACFIDAGTLPGLPPSTVVRVMGDTIEVLREGAVVIK